MKVKLVIHTAACCQRFAPKFSAAQRFLDSEVLRDSEPYVPKQTGNLIRSGNIGTVIGSGKVIYNAPYARKCYYARGTDYSNGKNPKACALWFEKAKAIKKDAWAASVNKIIKDG